MMRGAADLQPTPSSQHASAGADLVSALRTKLKGDVIDPTHPSYDSARLVWNGLIDRRPAVIARCADTADVVHAVHVARQFRPLVSIRGGGHQIAGSAVCDDGLVIDLSAMKQVVVDADRRVVRAQGGVTWGELDRATQAAGLATPGGEVSTTGIAGFTLGGGMGLMMRAYGLACDNLRAVELVTAAGDVVRASAAENRDLFWAVRGGGRGIGVVTTFEFDLYPIGPDVAAAQVFYPAEEAAAILRAWPGVVAEMPESVSPEVVLWSVPPDPAIPAQLHGRSAVIVQAMHAGPVEEGMALVDPLRRLGTPLLDASGPVPYVALQSSVDALFPAGARYYMKSHFMAALPDDVLTRLIDAHVRSPTPECLIVIRTMGGAIARVGPEASAFPHRSALYNVSIDAGWSDADRDEEAIGWARATWNALTPHATGGVYINFAGLGEDAEDMRGAVFGSSEARLDEVRTAWDPAGLFAAAARQP